MSSYVASALYSQDQQSYHGRFSSTWKEVPLIFAIAYNHFAEKNEELNRVSDIYLLYSL